MQFHRRVAIKSSIKKMTGGGAAKLRSHLDYIQRDGTDERGDRAGLYGPRVEVSGSDVDIDETLPGKAFADRCRSNRHHFRFIVAPEDGAKLQDLSSFTRDLVGQMERDLGTKLDWVAANHYDTGQPHTHLLVRGVRDDGRDLVIPRRYISQTMRERAQDLVATELGPVSQLEGRARLAKTVEAQSFTSLDRSLAAQWEGGVVDLGGPTQPGRVWHRQLQVRRLNILAKMGLAERLGSGRWAVKPDFEQTLREISERRDIVKALHRAMRRRDGESLATPDRLISERNKFDPNRMSAHPVTGIVREFGRPDDTRDGGFVVIEDSPGQPVYASVADDETFETLKREQIVTFLPHPKGARKIDRSIAAFARENGGVYSEVRHVTQGHGVSRAYAQAHSRRLEALRRRRHVSRNADGSWRIPDDYLDRAALYQAERASRLPTPLQRSSRLTLRQMEAARGVTWLDRTLSEKDGASAWTGAFGEALERRRQSLEKMGFAFEQHEALPKEALGRLEAMDLQDAGAELSEKIGKPYAASGVSRRIEGIYREAVERPSGTFAVIERARDFTLVPWRPIMERRLGKSISGRVSAGGISWDATGRQGPTR
ncbi:MAG: DUF3363 domain-containing protein [Litorimonas sp.]